MLYVYLEDDGEKFDVCLGTEELDQNPFIIASFFDEVQANNKAQEFAQKLVDGGAKVKLY